MNRGHRKSFTRQEMVRLTGRAFHVYNRGVDRQVIYRSDKFYTKFLDFVNHFLNPAEASIMAFCLMPNHFHMLIKQLKAFGISAFMEAVCGEYAKHVNHSLSRTGHLFEGRYRMKVAREDDSCLQIARYIHLNPSNAGLVKNPEEWIYSSCGSYVGKPAQSFLTTEPLLFQLDRDRTDPSFLAALNVNAPELPHHLVFRE